MPKSKANKTFKHLQNVKIKILPSFSNQRGNLHWFDVICQFKVEWFKNKINAELFFPKKIVIFCWAIEL